MAPAMTEGRKLFKPIPLFDQTSSGRTRPLVALLLGALLSIGSDRIGAQDSWQLGGSATFTSDYVYRGISQTMSKPALQLGLSIEHDSGWFGMLWGSNVDYVAAGDPDDGIDREINLIAGYQHSLSDSMALELSAMQYLVDGSARDSDERFTEWTVALIGNEQHRLEASYAGDAWATGQSSWHYAASTSWPLLRGVDATLVGGFYDLEQALGDAYAYGSIGLSGSNDQRAWSLEYHATAGASDEAFYRSTSASRLVGSIEFFF